MVECFRLLKYKSCKCSAVGEQGTRMAPTLASEGVNTEAAAVYAICSLASFVENTKSDTRLMSVPFILQPLCSSLLKPRTIQNGCI